MLSHKPKIGITIGDINGIGIEVIIKTFTDERMFDFCIPIVYGSGKIFSYHKNILGLKDFQYFLTSSTDKIKPNQLNILNSWDDEVQISIGKADKNLGVFSIKSLEAASYDLSQGKIAAIVTAPVNKSLLGDGQKIFSGQTEFFAEKFKAKETLMFMVSEGVKLGLVTNHVAVKDIASKITKEAVLKKIKLMAGSLSRDFGIDRPKIAVLGLNPHSGENGTIGREEIEAINPAIEQAKSDGILAFGAISGDGLFGSGGYREFDGILAMYHDQGLIPFKTLSFGRGVNYTAGLSIVRTSPDHGVGYNIAGQNLASPDSFREAVFMALDIMNNRANYDESRANPLQKTELASEEI